MKKGEHTGAFRISGFPPLFILAALLLALSTVTGAYALLTHYSQVYTAQIETASMGITLLENGSTAASQNYSEKKRGWEGEQYPLMENLPQQSDGFIQLGRAYPEVLSVQNSGAISAYVRVRITRYWVTTAGEKNPNLSPELIQINFLTDHWLLDTSVSTPEQTTLYYPEILLPGENTPAFTDTVTLSPEIATMVREEMVADGNTTVIRTLYDYDGMQFRLEAEVDAVQTHNAADAVKSAWGGTATISDGKLRLN